MEQFRGTTILGTPQRWLDYGDGQVTGNTVMKGNARKVRFLRLYHDKVIAGFAGGTADAFTLSNASEAKLEKHQGHLVRSAVELAKDWRTDRMLRRLEALLAVADKDASLIITGNGDVIQPETTSSPLAPRFHSPNLPPAPFMKTPNCQRATSSRNP